MNSLAESKTIFESMGHINPWIQLGVGSALVVAAFTFNRLVKTRDDDDDSGIGCLVFVVASAGLTIVFHALGVLG